MKNKLKKNVPSCKIISQKEPGKEESKKPKKFLKKNNLCKGFKNCNDKIDNSMDEYIQENSTYSTDLSENN